MVAVASVAAILLCVLIAVSEATGFHHALSKAGSSSKSSKKRSKSSHRKKKADYKAGAGPFRSKKEGKVGKDKRFEVDEAKKKVEIKVKTSPVRCRGQNT